MNNYFFNNKISKNIKLISDGDIASTLKTDIIISLLLEEDKEELTYFSAPILCNKISQIPLEEIKFVEQGETIILNKEFLKKAINTKIISNIYDKVCKEYVNGYGYDKKINIKKLLEEHIDKMNIYFGELPENICGVTLYSGDVIINGKYLNLIYSKNKKNKDIFKKQAVCSIFLTLLHEFSHILVRLIKAKLPNKNVKNQFVESEDLSSINEPDSNLKNYKLKELQTIFSWKKNKIIAQFDSLIKDYNKTTKSKNTVAKNKGLNESGKFFDYNLYGIDSYFDLTKDESDFFLNMNSFDKTNKKYYDNLQKLYNKRNKNSKGYPFKTINSRPYTVSFGICNFSNRSK